jgi:hypothetical protein
VGKPDPSNVCTDAVALAHQVDSGHGHNPIIPSRFGGQGLLARVSSPGVMQEWALQPHSFQQKTGNN